MFMFTVHQNHWRNANKVLTLSSHGCTLYVSGWKYTTHVTLCTLRRQVRD